MARPLNPVGFFKFTVKAEGVSVRKMTTAVSMSTVSLGAMFAVCKYVTSEEQLFKNAVIEGFRCDREDLEMGRIEPGCEHVVLYCFTNEKFMDVLDDFNSGGVLKRLKKAFSNIGLETKGLKVDIENIKEVEDKKETVKGKHSPQIIVQGGAYSRRTWNDVTENEYKSAIKNSAIEGYKVLTSGGTAVDAVEAAVRVLEDNKDFDAGYGSPLNNDGEVECDAMIMDGNTLNSGAVTSGRHFRNPVSLAKLIMKDSYHCGLSGKGARKFAEEKGFDVFHDKRQLITERANAEKISYEEFVEFVKARFRGDLVRESGASAVVEDSSNSSVEDSSGGTAVAKDDTTLPGSDTVSAVARDANGYFACAVSTGGAAGRLRGRVSDASMVGCGGYANKYGAATTSGLGESLIKMTLARDVVYMMEGGRNSQDSAKESLEKMKCQLNDVGGVIAIDQQGNFGRHCSTKMMGWASIKSNTVRFGLNQNGDDIQVQQLNV